MTRPLSSAAVELLRRIVERADAGFPVNEYGVDLRRANALDARGFVELRTEPSTIPGRRAWERWHPTAAGRAYLAELEAAR